MKVITDKPSIDSQIKVDNQRVYSFFNYEYTTEQIRFTTLALLEKLKLLDVGYTSVLNYGKEFQDYYNDFCVMYNKRKLNIDFTSYDSVYGLLDVKDTLQKVHINLVVEACYEAKDLDTLYITEKTFRNYYLKKPFLLIGQYESLAALQDIGYKSFSPFINEEYDRVPDGAVRLRMIFDELKRLCSFSKEEWDNFHDNIKHIVEHNYKINTTVRPESSYNIFRKYINGEHK